MSDQPPYRWISSSRTDVGMVRRINEDSCIERPEVGVWAVADGMGGHKAGDVASEMIVKALSTLPEHSSLGTLIDDMEDRLLAVNATLRAFAAKEGTQAIGSTLAVLVARGAYGICVWAGDSRVYRYRGGHIEQVSQDHALVEELVEKGLVSREDAPSHPQANLVTRAVGATDALFLDMEIFELDDGDVFVLCTDGLDKELQPDEIAEVIDRELPEDLSNVLIDIGLSRGARDNLTVVAVHISAFAGTDPAPTA